MAPSDNVVPLTPATVIPIDPGLVTPAQQREAVISLLRRMLDKADAGDVQAIAVAAIGPDLSNRVFTSVYTGSAEYLLLSALTRLSHEINRMIDSDDEENAYAE